MLPAIPKTKLIATNIPAKIFSKNHPDFPLIANIVLVSIQIKSPVVDVISHQRSIGENA
jgi:hypothetical protein